jgi:hypothetical protein
MTKSSAIVIPLSSSNVDQENSDSRKRRSTRNVVGDAKPEPIQKSEPNKRKTKASSKVLFILWSLCLIHSLPDTFVLLFVF